MILLLTLLGNELTRNSASSFFFRFYFRMNTSGLVKEKFETINSYNENLIKKPEVPKERQITVVLVKFPLVHFSRFGEL